MCRTATIRSALQSADPGASNAGSNVEIWPLGADVIAFEISGLTKKSEFLSTFLPISNSISGKPRQIKTHEVGRIRSDFDV